MSAPLELYAKTSFVPSTSPPGEIITRVLRPAQLPVSSSSEFIRDWNREIAYSESEVWALARLPAVTVPSYTQRSQGNLGGTGGVTPVRLLDRPTNELLVTQHFISLVGRLVKFVFTGADSSPLLSESSTTHLSRYRWAAPDGTGSGSADVAMRRPLDMSEEDWGYMLNFIGKFKLMPTEVSPLGVLVG